MTISSLTDVTNGVRDHILQLTKIECFNYWRRVAGFHEINSFHVWDKLTFTVIFYFQSIFLLSVKNFFQKQIEIFITYDSILMQVVSLKCIVSKSSIPTCY